MKYGIMGYVWSEWWSGMDHNLWNGVKKCPAISAVYYSIAERRSNLKIWNGNEVDHEVKWMKCGRMNGIRYDMNEWNEMNEVWNEMKWNEMDHKWNGSALMIL